jgi:hypothetical protein
VKWIVNTDDGKSVELEQADLLDILFNKMIQDSKGSEREDFDILIKVFAQFMQERKAVMSTTIEQLLSMSMAMGYFYRVFLEKNNVQKVGEKREEPIRQSNDKPRKESIN